MNTPGAQRRGTVRRGIQVLATAVALVLVGTGCGGSPTAGGQKASGGQTAAEKVYAEVAGLSGNLRSA